MDVTLDYIVIEGGRFDPRPFRYHTVTVGKSFTPTCLCSPSSIDRYRPTAVTLSGKVTVGLTK